MIQRMSHTTIYVLNQDDALEFYTKKLGFAVRTDSRMGDFRWLTVGPQEQPELEIVLMEIRPGMVWDEATANQLKEIVRKGVLGAGVFDTDDCRKTYDELKRQGVEFLSEPQDRPYGVEAVFKDNSGNWFSLTQHK